MMRISLASVAGLALLPITANAQSVSDTKEFAVVGTVPSICVGGSVSESGGIFDLGVLTNTSTGLLRSDLSAPVQVLSGSFCSSRSTIAIAATPLAAQNFAGPTPSGFSRSVDYVATASGWTEAPAVFGTANATNAAALQTRDTAFSGTITVSLSDFATSGGSALRMIADEDYRGEVTVTLTPES